MQLPGRHSLDTDILEFPKHSNATQRRKNILNQNNSSQKKKNWGYTDSEDTL